MNTDKSKFMRLNGRDFFRGLLVAVGAAALGVLYGAVQTDFSLTWEYWQPVIVDTIKASIQGFLAYLALNLFTNSTGGVAMK
jgi:hypothetical protein